MHETALAYGPAAVYLLAVSAVLFRTGRFPLRGHVPLLAAGLAVRVYDDGLAALVPVAAACGAFVIGVLIGKRLISGVGLMSFVVAVALLPPQGWVGLLIGLFAAAVVGAAAGVRAHGPARLHMVTGETLGAMGMRGGRLSRPDLSRLPLTRDDTGIDEPQEAVSRPAGSTLYLAPFLLAGTCAAWVAAAVAANT